MLGALLRREQRRLGHAPREQPDQSYQEAPEVVQRLAANDPRLGFSRPEGREQSHELRQNQI